MGASKYDNEIYIGQTFGKLTVVGLALNDTNNFVWKCSCSCNGNIKMYPPSKVFNGKTSSCGCEKINNKAKYNDKDKYIGKIFNGLQVISIEKSEFQYEGILWGCKCLGCNRTDLLYPAKHVASGRYTSCGSVECRRKLHLANTKYDSDKYIGQTFGFLTVQKIKYGPIPNTNSTGVLWECTCNNCGSLVTHSAEAIVKGNNSSCGCIVSLHEQWIKQILTDNNIVFKSQVSFDGLVGIGGGKLRFDFALIDRRGNRKLLEYDGEQHNKEKSINSGWDIDRVIENDKIKNEYCKINNIELIRITKRFYNKESLQKYLINNNII